MLKRLAATLLIFLCLTGCAAGVSSLKSYVDSLDGYEFLYPNGWVPVSVSNGPDVVFHDLIETTENISVVISEVPKGKTLADLGTPTEVGYKLAKSAIAPADSGREADLVRVDKLETDAKTYYLLEYAVKLPNQQQRHNLASVAVSRGKLFTFNASTSERRWTKVKPTLDAVVKSFTVY